MNDSYQKVYYKQRVNWDCITEYINKYKCGIFEFDAKFLDPSNQSFAFTDLIVKIKESSFIKFYRGDSNGKHIVVILFKGNGEKQLGNSLEDAVFRLNYMESRFNKDPTLR